ncbi:MAG: hypothetical protein AAGB51_09230 [Planctomycetota bacterium]
MSIVDTLWERLVSAGPLAKAGIACVPVVAALGVRFVAPIGPRSSEGAEMQIEATPNLTATLNTAVRIRGASATVGSDRPVDVSPMLDLGVSSVEPTRTERWDNDPEELFEVSSVITGPRPVAVINGKPFVAGQMIGDGWVLMSIDAEQFEVRLRHKHRGDATLNWSPSD